MTNAPLHKNQAGQPTKNGGEFAAVSKPDGDVALVETPADITLYEYQYDVYTRTALASKLELDSDGPALDQFIAENAPTDDWSGVAPFTEPLMVVPGDDAIELWDIEKQLVDDQLRSVDARFDEQTGDVIVSATYYEDFLWSDEFTSEELSNAFPLVEEFMHERFGARLETDDTGWDSASLTFEASFRPEEYCESLVVRGFDERTKFTRFVNEHDPGTFGSPYAYSELRRKLDDAVVLPSRWMALSLAAHVDPVRVADSLPAGSAPTDAEALAIAGSLVIDGYTGKGASEMERLSAHGWAYDADSIREGAESILDDATAVPNMQARAACLIAWLDRDDL